MRHFIDDLQQFVYNAKAFYKQKESDQYKLPNKSIFYHVRYSIEQLPESGFKNNPGHNNHSEHSTNVHFAR